MAAYMTLNLDSDPRGTGSYRFDRSDYMTYTTCMGCGHEVHEADLVPDPQYPKDRICKGCAEAIKEEMLNTQI